MVPMLPVCTLKWLSAPSPGSICVAPLWLPTPSCVSVSANCSPPPVLCAPPPVLCAPPPVLCPFRFACDLCHEEATDGHPMKWATRWVHGGEGEGALGASR